LCFLCFLYILVLILVLALRRIWKLPYNCHTAILERLSGTITIFDTLCKRSMNFVQKCLHSENVLVNFVSRHAVFYSRMLSGMGRNVQFLADEEMIWRAYMIKELVMVRDEVCCLSSDEFFRDDVLALIFNLSVS